MKIIVSGKNNYKMPRVAIRQKVKPMVKFPNVKKEVWKK